MENKLIQMTSFVVNESENLDYDSFNRVVRYAKFLKQLLTLGMFVPCDENGNVLEAGGRCQRNCSCGEEAVQDCKELRWEKYEKAKENVLFKGFEFLESWGEFWHLMHESGNNLLIRKDETTSIEKKLLAQSYQIELTESALKQIGLKTK